MHCWLRLLGNVTCLSAALINECCIDIKRSIFVLNWNWLFVISSLCTDCSLLPLTCFSWHIYSFMHPLSHRINCSQACGPFVNYTTSWEVLPTTVSQLPHGLQTLLYGLSSEAFAVSFFVVTWYVFPSGVPALMIVSKLFQLLVTSGLFSLPCSLAMFYVIALAGAHKRVINQLREQLVMVGLLKNWWFFSMSFLDHTLPMLDHHFELLPKLRSTIRVVLSPRRAVTSVSWSKSCARPRSSQLSDPQCPNPSPAAAAAAPPTTPASPTISMKVCFWHTRLLTLPRMCEARNWNYRCKDWTDGLR